jgi:hypothetical protein
LFSFCSGADGSWNISRERLNSYAQLMAADALT